MFDRKSVDSFEKIKFPIAAKLVVIISILVILSLGLITALVTWFGKEDVQITAEANNKTVNKQTAMATEKDLLSLRANAMLFLDILSTFPSASALSKQAESYYFERNASIASIILTDANRASNIEKKLISSSFFLSNELDTELLNTFFEQYKDTIKNSEEGITQIVNVAPLFKIPMLVLLYPYKEKGINQSLIIFFSTEKLSDSFGAGSLQTTFLVNNLGDVLIHPDFNIVKTGLNLKDYKLFSEMRKNGDFDRQIIFEDKDNNRFYGSYTRLSFADIAILTVASIDNVLEPVYDTTKRNLYLTIAVLALSIIFVWFFAKSISTPVKSLAIAAEKIEKGQYEVNLTPKSRDELGLLTASFVQMGKGLAERERLKDSFSRFINKEIAELAAQGKLSLGGETKKTTIFFSDIRSFTAISEKLEPSEVVEFLNEYMTAMVDCVNITHGVVDKFIGDAIMAVWGAPKSSSSPKEDALNCVRAAMRMRAALIVFNRGRGGDKKPIIKIGCGINSGDVVAGQIGSDKRMEYTVIGDAVNLASRTEALNKPMGTDILITEYTYNLIKEHVIVEEMPSVTVKGKEKPLKMFAVVNMPNENQIPGAGEKGPKTLNQVRQVLGIPIPDFTKVDVDTDEKKYKIGQ